MESTLEQLSVRLHPHDNVAIAKQDLPAGTRIQMPGRVSLTVGQNIPVGHKFALVHIDAGESVLRYGCPIGIATAPIEAGDWVHTHNVSVGEIAREYTWTVVEPLRVEPAQHTFMGYRRSDGQVGTRNYVAVISTVNCSAHVVTQIARAFTPERLAAFPNVDGVIPIVHTSGCSIVPGDVRDTPGALSYTYLQRCLANVARNPNIGACLFVGLGCEVNPVDGYCEAGCTNVTAGAQPLPLYGAGMVIQEHGGFRATVDAGVRAVESLLPRANACARTPAPVSALNLALQCGGSDGWSGVTANPLLGRVVDALVREGGTAVLAETPEIFGAEHLLMQRVTSPEVGWKLAARFQWWNEQSARFGFTVDNNPTPGNKRGGLTTIFEKSLGAAAKGGSTPLAAVYEYAERVTARGLVFMDTPGNDPISATGQLAGGCNLIVFTTGRGSVFGSNIAPCVKVASNSALYARMPGDMDYNAGKLLDGTAVDTAVQELAQLVLAVASGQRTCSEQNGLSEMEFIPWQIGTAV